MKKKEKKKERERKKKIRDKIRTFMDMAQAVRTVDSRVLLIRQITDFIDNEFPNMKEFQKIKTWAEAIINNKNYGPTSTNFKDDVSSILIAILMTYDQDTPNDFNIVFHPEVIKHSIQLFNDGHYAQAIFESAKALNNYVKDKGKIMDKDLSDAMAKAFNEKTPIIKLNALKSQSDIDEQQGFKFLYMGAMTGIRNPKAHDTVKQKDKNRTLEYLAFLSLLFRRAEEGKL
ncbi:hypothetical protein LCGC14_1456130 [marine sediment metagenome]|uniref:Conserved hypothetical protein CHP02391 domain-containing protein n=1 Tax=marine sediment metagenome TaxID=412755 RepID=A0A0F9LX38_9ZZZZ